MDDKDLMQLKSQRDFLSKIEPYELKSSNFRNK